MIFHPVALFSALCICNILRGGSESDNDKQCSKCKPVGHHNLFEVKIIKRSNGMEHGVWGMGSKKTASFS
jgi:hypothetical protein